MQIESKDLEKIIRLSYLSPSDTETLTKQLSNILTLVDAIKDVNTEGIEPLVTPVVTSINFCDDAVDKVDIKDTVLKNAPKKRNGYFIVPKVIE